MLFIMQGLVDSNPTRQEDGDINTQEYVTFTFTVTFHFVHLYVNDCVQGCILLNLHDNFIH